MTLYNVSIVTHELKANMTGYIILHCTLLVLSHMRSNIVLHILLHCYLTVVIVFLEAPVKRLLHQIQEVTMQYITWID